MKRRPPLRVLLAALSANADYEGGLALACLKAYAEGCRKPRRGRAEVSLREWIVGSASAKTLAGRIAAEKPDLVGFSCYAWNVAEVRRVVRALRAAAPGVLILVGGPEASSDPAAWIMERGADLVVCGEGEATFAELLDRAAVPGPRSLGRGAGFAGVAGLAFRSRGRAVVNPPRPPLRDLDRLPSPCGLTGAGRREWTVLETARGCPFDCAFCAWPGKGSRVRRFSPARIRADIRLLLRTGAKKVLVADADIFQDRAAGARLLRLIRREDPAGRLGFEFETNPEHIDRVGARLADRPAFSFKAALQSANPAAFFPCNRRFDLGKAARGLRLLRREAPSARIKTQLVLGLPGDTLAGFRRSLDWVWSQGVDTCEVYHLMVLPGTPFARDCGRHGLRWQKEPPYLVTSTDGFSAADIRAARRLLFDAVFLLGLGPVRLVLDEAAEARKEGSVTRLCSELADWLETEGDFSPRRLFETIESSRPPNELLPFQEWPARRVSLRDRLAILRGAARWAASRFGSAGEPARVLEAAVNRALFTGVCRNPALARSLRGAGGGPTLLFCWARDSHLQAGLEGVAGLVLLSEDPHDTRHVLGSPLPVRGILRMGRRAPLPRPADWGGGYRRVVFANALSGLPGDAGAWLAGLRRRCRPGARLTILDDFRGRPVSAVMADLRKGGWRPDPPRRAFGSGSATWSRLEGSAP